MLAICFDTEVLTNVLLPPLPQGGVKANRHSLALVEASLKKLEEAQTLAAAANAASQRGMLLEMYQTEAQVGPKP